VTITDLLPDASRLDQALCQLVELPDGVAVDEPAFTIAEAVERTGVGAHTLRYYERVGLIDDVPRARGGQRLYTLRSLGRIVFLSRMRATGMSIDSLRTYVGLIRAGAQTSPERRELLEAHRRDVLERIATLQEAVAILDVKIDDYRIWEQQQ
jgi:DNA-binding transcriptional MerR regulator